MKWICRIISCNTLYTALQLCKVWHICATGKIKYWIDTSPLSCESFNLQSENIAACFSYSMPHSNSKARALCVCVPNLNFYQFRHEFEISVAIQCAGNYYCRLLVRLLPPPPRPFSLSLPRSSPSMWSQTKNVIRRWKSTRGETNIRVMLMSL